MTDIDIDFADRTPALAGLRWVAAVQRRNAHRERHVSGVYFQDIPIDPLDGMAVWDYEDAADRGYFKIDCLNNLIYTGVRDEAHLIDLLVRDPPWDAFADRDIVAALAHIGGHHEIARMIRPRSIIDLAICIALIRPGKRHLVGCSRETIDKEVWIRTEKYYYKKAHAVAFATAIVVQLNLLVEQALMSE
jgi:hypothetical protein